MNPLDLLALTYPTGIYYADFWDAAMRVGSVVVELDDINDDEFFGREEAAVLADNAGLNYHLYALLYW